MGLTEGAQVLDVGTGRGANLFPAAEAVGPRGQVMGIDVAPGMVRETTAEIARRNLPYVSILQMDAEHLTFPDASFDAALCGFAIFLFPDLEQALSEFFRVLRPGGKVGITVAQDLDALSHWYRECISDYHARYHFPLHAGGGEGSNYAQLPDYLTQAGFSDVQILQEEADFVYTNAQEWWDSRWTHGTRYSLEQMAPEVLAQFKDEVFTRLAQEAQSHDIHEMLLLKYIVADKKL
ncbi:MAG: methyltransferase domain-containing protein [Chloroflexota bacterium]|nr:methyltransferase domain-containing protein [Chloroflexota bacterium]